MLMMRNSTTSPKYFSLMMPSRVLASAKTWWRQFVIGQLPPELSLRSRAKMIN
jgi:hypothetical protein